MFREQSKDEVYALALAWLCHGGVTRLKVTQFHDCIRTAKARVGCRVAESSQQCLRMTNAVISTVFSDVEVISDRRTRSVVGGGGMSAFLAFVVKIRYYGAADPDRGGAAFANVCGSFLNFGSTGKPLRIRYAPRGRPTHPTSVEQPAT